MARGVVEGGLSKAAAARLFNTTPKMVAKWVGRFRANAWRACRTVPQGRIHRQAKQSRPYTPPSKVRRRRHPGAQIAEVGVSAGTSLPA
jgi:hypothetical protein